MIELTKLETLFILDLLKDFVDPSEIIFPEELEQAIEILEACLDEHEKL